MSYDFRSHRLFVLGDLFAGAEIKADQSRANYLLNVLRMKRGDPILLFNGRDGEWRARMAETGRRDCILLAEEQLREQTVAPDLNYLFAPLKHARLDYLVQKAVEMGAGRLRPVLTAFTQANRLNRRRMEANAVQAAEQCGILAIPHIDPPVQLKEVLADWDHHRRIVFCDEGARAANPVDALRDLPPGRVALLVGPEGGFSEDERKDLLGRSYVTPISLGPRILRADTAAVAALALVQSFIGDWR